MLGTGNNEAGNLTYNISGNAAAESSEKTFTVAGLTGTTTLALNIYSFTPNTAYNIQDNNLTDGGNTITQATADLSGMLSFSGILGSTHQYEIFAGSLDATPPSVSLTTPTAGSTVSGSSVMLTAAASDNVAVANVQFEVDGTDIGSAVTSSPYTTSWNSTGAADGSHTLYAVAEDTSGNYATSNIIITVHNAVSASTSSGGGGFIVGSGPLAPGYVNTNPQTNAVTIAST